MLKGCESGSFISLTTRSKLFTDRRQKVCHPDEVPSRSGENNLTVIILPKEEQQPGVEDLGKTAYRFLRFSKTDDRGTIQGDLVIEHLST